MKATDFERALSTAEEQGLPMTGLTRDHLMRCFAEQRANKPELTDEQLERVARNEGKRGSPLSDFVWSLGCEQSPDRMPAGRGENDANRSFALLYEREFKAVKATLLRQVPGAWSRVEEAVIDAFANAYATYWSPRATRRVGGTARLRTVLVNIARNALTKGGGPDPELDGGDGLTQVPGQPQGLGDSEREEIAAAWVECLKGLPVREGFIVDQRLRLEVPGNEVAETLSIGKAAVSMALSRGTPKMRKCLEGKGFGLPEVEE